MTSHDEQADAPMGEVERLLRRSGRREQPDPIYRNQARIAVRAAWRESRHAQQRQRWLLLGAPALAAAAGLLLATALWRQAPTRAGAEIVARVATMSDALRVRRGSPAEPGAGGERLAIGDPIRAGDVVDTQANVVAAFALVGGGEIRQNGGTSLRWTSPRQVALDNGHIYLDSGGAAVAVTTPAGVVRDIGTRFDVRVHEGALRVRVREGAVRVETAASAHEARAGRAIVVTAAGTIDEQAAATFGDDWDWVLRATSFRLGGARLGAFINWVETESGRRVEFRPAALRAETAAIRLDGSIAGLSIADALNVVLPAAGLGHQIDGDRIVIERPSARVRP